MIDGVIQQYGDLKKSINEVIQAKLANSLLEAGNADYVKAIQGEADAYNAMMLAQEAASAQRERMEKAYDEEHQAWLEYEAAVSRWGEEQARGFYEMWEEYERASHEESDLYNQKLDEYNTLTDTYVGMQTTIVNYEKAQEEALKGNYQTAVDIFSKKGQIYTDHTDTVDKETAQVLAALEKEARDAGIKAKTIKTNFENGVAGYTKKMVTEAEKGYQDALGKWASAYSDAQGLGEDFGQGLADGIKLKNGVVGAAAIAQIREAVNAAKKEAEINSPSKKTMRIGEGFGEGAEVGIENTTKDVERAASNQAAAILDAYSEQEIKAQKTLRSIADQQAAHQATGRMVVASANSGMLEKILQAIEKGQVLTIDGDALVGATANKMDNALGRRRALASRGAI